MSDTNNLVLVKDVRVVFPNLIEPKPVMRNGKPVGDPKYSLTLLIEDEQVLKELKNKMAAAAKAKWPGRNLAEDIKFNRFNWPLIPGSKAKATAEAKGKNGEFYEGCTVLKSDSKFAPGLLDENKQEINPSAPFAGRAFYNGVYCHVEISVVAYDGVSGGSDGVKAYLQNVMKSRDGEKLIGRSVTDAFAGISGGESDYDPTGGEDPDDDEIPF